MTNIQASIGLVQLSEYEEMLKHRHEIVLEYDQVFNNMNVDILNHSSKNHKSSAHLYFVMLYGINESQRNE